MSNEGTAPGERGLAAPEHDGVEQNPRRAAGRRIDCSARPAEGTSPTSRRRLASNRAQPAYSPGQRGRGPAGE